jgi:hypothetical protein
MAGGALSNLMELSGALLNLLHPGRLGAAADVRKRLLSRVLDQAPQSRSLRRRQGSVLEAVRLVLEGRAKPMRVRDIHAEVERAFRAAVPFSSVNDALSTHAAEHEGPFRRVRYGVYEVRS